MLTLARSHCIARDKVFRLSTLSLCSTRSALVSFTLLLGRAGLRSLLDCKASRILVFLTTNLSQLFNRETWRSGYQNEDHLILILDPAFKKAEEVIVAEEEAEKGRRDDDDDDCDDHWGKEESAGGRGGRRRDIVTHRERKRESSHRIKTIC